MANRITTKATKIGILLLVCVLAVVLLVACNNSNNNNSNQPGETVSYTVQFYVDGALYDTKTVDATTQSITLPTNPTKDGYAFEGWYLDQDTWANAFGTTTKVTKSISVYAKWHKIGGTDPDTPTPTAGNTDLAITGYTAEGNTFSAAVSHAVATLDLGALVTVDEGSAFAIYSDAACTTAVQGALTLVEGANTYYVKVIASDNATKVYTLLIYRKRVYTVTYVSYGDTVFTTAEVEEGAKAVDPLTGEQADNPVRDGYTFDGWDYDFDTVVQADVTVQARWTVRTFRVRFDGVSEVVDATYDAAMPAVTHTPAKAGYTFGGYADSEGVLYYNADLTSARVWDKAEHDVVLVGVWTINQYTVRFVGADGDFLVQQADYGTVIGAPEGTPTKKGYTFAGWEHDFPFPLAEDTVIAAQWTVKTYTVGFANTEVTVTATFDADMPTINLDAYKEGYLFGGYAYGDVLYYDSDFSSAHVWDVDEDNVMLTAVWTAGKYRVSLNPANGQNYGQAQLTFGENYTLAVPSKTGYSFVGWYATVGEDEVQMTSADGVSLQPSAVKDSSWTFTAHWSPISVVATLDPNGGTVVPGTIVLTYDQNEYSIPVAEKDGCAFLGWYLGDVAYTNEVGASIRTWDIPEDTTLLAKYYEVDYVITFDMNEGAPQQASLTANYNGAWPVVTTIPTRTGYTFLGYYSTNEVLVYAVEEGEMVCKVNQFYFTHNTTLEARWTPIRVYVFFEHEGGESTLAS